MASKKKQTKKVEAKFTDIIHEVRDGVLMDVFLNKGKEVKVELSKEK